MFEKYTQQSNNTLMKYPIIQKIAEDTRWTVSDKRKRPVDAKYLLEEQQVRDARVYDEINPLVSLHELNEDENLQYTNRAYRLQAQINNIIVIDVEPEASDEMLEMAVNFPAHLTEISTNGGVHLFIEVPEKAITEENKYIFETTVIKSDNNDFEVLANDHFITLTKRFVLDKPIADFENNEDDFEWLTTFLDNIVKMDYEKQRNREMMREMSTNFDNENIRKDLVQRLLDSKPFIDFIERQMKKNVEDFANDNSRYEASVATASAGFVHRFVENLPNTSVLKDTFGEMDENDWIYTAYAMTKYIIPFRDKHQEYRDGLPWLMYNARNGWTFIQMKNKQGD